MSDLQIAGVVAGAIIVVVLLINVKDIARYIRISSMSAPAPSFLGNRPEAVAGFFIEPSESAAGTFPRSDCPIQTQVGTFASSR
jgi:hypothetical protein